MSGPEEKIRHLIKKKYPAGFVTDIEEDAIPPGLGEEIIRLISARKNEPRFMLEWRLRAYRHWPTMHEPTWVQVRYDLIDYQDIVYYSAPAGQVSRDAQYAKRDIQVPLLPQPPRVRAVSPHHRKLGAGYAALPQWLDGVSDAYAASPLAQGTTGMLRAAYAYCELPAFVSLSMAGSAAAPDQVHPAGWWRQAR